MGGWRALDIELDAWAATGRTATFWWRDDDAVRAGPALRRLLDLTWNMDVPLALAVIPAAANADLAPALSSVPEAVVLQHGWDHTNHAAPPAKKAELAAGRPWEQAVADLARGRDGLATLFPDRFRPVLVPPWNRIDPHLVERLAAVGFSALSTFKARLAAWAGPGLRQVNCHVDPVDWRGGRGFAGDDRVLGAVIAHLQARRAGQADADEPTGVLTHHGVHDDPTWIFLRRLAAHVRGHAGATWIGVDAALEACR